MPRLGESRASSSSSGGMPFIVSSNAEKADPATRKLIRSHVMRGKKRKRERPDRNRPAIGCGAIVGRAEDARIRLEDVIEAYTPLVPDRVGSDLSFVEFAEEIEVSMLLNMAKGLQLLDIQHTWLT